MHAYLLIGSNHAKIKSQIKSLATNKTLAPFNLEKIADVRELQKFTKLSVKSKTAIIINKFENATPEAQNAFLKILEEPQPNLEFIVIAKNSHNILPTILSRAQSVRVGESGLTKKQIEKASEFWGSKKAQKLEMIKKIKNRDGAKLFLEIIIKGGQQNLNKNFDQANSLEAAIYTLDAINKNGNVKLQLTNFVVNGC